MVFFGYHKIEGKMAYYKRHKGTYLQLIAEKIRGTGESRGTVQLDWAQVSQAQGPAARYVS